MGTRWRRIKSRGFTRSRPIGACAIARATWRFCSPAEGQIRVLITMEGVEPLGSDLDLLRVFYELGLRSLASQCAESPEPALSSRPLLAHDG